MVDDDIYYDLANNRGSTDPQQESARKELEDFFDKRRENVFFTRQIEILYENTYFHWVTGRAIQDLAESGKIRVEKRSLKTGGEIHLLWHRNYRYYRRKAQEVVKLVEEYAAPNICAAIGMHGQMMVLEAFARCQFLMMSKDTREHGGKKWEKTDHNLDFIFGRDGLVYGIEVKNALGYMDYEEFKIKVKICDYLNIRPVFVVRMMPKTWINELWERKGFALILKYQLYPWGHKELAKRVATSLNIPVDSPRAISDGTMERFMKWHKRNL